MSLDMEEANYKDFMDEDKKALKRLLCKATETLRDVNQSMNEDKTVQRYIYISLRKKPNRSH